MVEYSVGNLVVKTAEQTADYSVVCLVGPTVDWTAENWVEC